MKANEFIKNLNEETLDEWSFTHVGIRKALEKKGYEFLGSGVDQSAYLEPSTGMVLKIFGTAQDIKRHPTEPKFTSGHEMFFTWAKFCMDRPNNPFLPKFGGFESFIYNNRTYLQIRQEYLTRISIELAIPIVDMANNIQVITGEMSKKVGQPVVDAIANSPFSRPTYKTFIKQFGSKNAHELMLTMIQLYNLGKRKGYIWDLHRENVMSRGNTPVIVDPWTM